MHETNCSKRRSCWQQEILASEVVLALLAARADLNERNRQGIRRDNGSDL